MSDETYSDLPFTTTEDDWPPAVVIEREPRKCRRHVWLTSTNGTLIETRCSRCDVLRDAAASRRGRLNRSRGNSIEREIAAKLGLRRVGQYGGPDDVRGDYLVVQVKSGAGFPERTWGWLRAMTADAGQTRAVVLTDAPGPGRKRRALICLELDDWISLHGPSAATEPTEREAGL